MAMNFIGSSSNYGEQACARLCQIIMEANDGMSQQIQENRTDLLDLKTLEELNSVDDFGLTLPYLAVNYDRPDMIKYLAKRGIDMNKPCDPMQFGTPMFYAVNMGKISVVEALHAVGCSLNNSCDTLFNYKPEYYASRTDNVMLRERIERIKSSEVRAANMFKRKYTAYKQRQNFIKRYNAAVKIQKRVRGVLDRRYVEQIRENGGFGSVEPSLFESMAEGSQHTGGGSAEEEGEGEDDDGSTQQRSRQPADDGGESLNAGASTFSGEDND